MISSDVSVRVGHKALAVLPFRNGGPADDDYLADGLTEELIDTLSMTRGLRLRPRGVVMRFKGSDSDAREVGAELGVDVIVEGSLRRAGAAYRISVRLIGVADGFQVWATRLDRPMTDLLVVVDELARAVAAAMAEEAQTHERRAPSNPLAVELYLRARREIREQWASRDGLLGALDLMDQAIALSPDDAILLGSAAIARVRAAFWGAGGEGRLERARREARRAIDLDPRVGEPWLALAMLELYAGRAHDGIPLLQLAITAAPQYARAHEALGRTLLETELVEQGRHHLETAFELDPADTYPKYDLARAYALLGDYDTADTLLADPCPNGPAGESYREATIIRLYLWRRAVGMPCAIPRPSDSSLVTGGARLVLSGFNDVVNTGNVSDEVRRGMEEYSVSSEILPRSRQVVSQYLAEMLFAAGDDAGAFGALDRAIDDNFPDLAFMDRCPLLDRLREDPRFVAARARIAPRARRVAEAWQSTVRAGSTRLVTTTPLPPAVVEVDASQCAREVAEISETDFFRQLKRDVAGMRRRTRA